MQRYKKVLPQPETLHSGVNICKDSNNRNQVIEKRIYPHT